MNYDFKLGFLGAGNMAKAIIENVIAGGIVNSKDIIASHADPTKNIGIEGIKSTLDNAEVIKNSEIVFIAVKPQVFAQIKESVLSNVNAKYVISMMAGVSSDSIRKYIDNDRAKVIRIMPNTPCKIGKGVTAIEKVDIPESDKSMIFDILRSTGELVEIEEELFDAVVSVSGSGPAYVYMFINAMINGGVKHGLTFDAAKKLAISTVIGTSELAKTGDNIEAMIDAVCSKGGTTIEAVKHFREQGLENIIEDGMYKCYLRSKELKG